MLLNKYSLYKIQAFFLSSGRILIDVQFSAGLTIKQNKNEFVKQKLNKTKTKKMTRKKKKKRKTAGASVFIL